MGRKKLIPYSKLCATCYQPFLTGKHKEKLNCSPECLKIYNELHKDERMDKTFIAIKKKYGVNSFPETKDFSKKVKQIKKEKYGDENYNNFNKIKQTLNKKYNVEAPNKIAGFSDKSKATKLEKYGDVNYNNRGKAKETTKEKYNTEHHLQNPECLDKMKKTNLERHGTEYTILTPKARQGLVDYNQNLHNTNYYFESDIHIQNILNEKIEKIKIILKNNNLEFNTEDYTRLRTTSEQDNKIHYIKYDIKCNVCQTIFESNFSNTPICRNCYPVNTNSKQQLEMKEFLIENKIDFIENTRKFIAPFEIDFYLPDYNLGIELNGNYFHSELFGKTKQYHLNKSTLCDNKNIKLIHIFEDEWINKKDIVKSRILHMANKTKEKIYARKCEIRLVDFKTKKEFLNINHIQGNDTNFSSIGLFYQNELYSLMTFSKLRLSLGSKQNCQEVELSRFCSKLNTTVVGGFEKLLNFFIKNNKHTFTSIITYADCRWSGINFKNTVYNKVGFEFEHKTPPNYFYMFKKDYYTRYHRFTFNKQKLIKMFNADKSLTEWEIAKENKMNRIWDCGSLKFKITISV